jgi:hypothetical protein
MLQQNISNSGSLFYVVVGSFAHLRPLYHIYRMSFLADTTITTLPRIYLWAAQLLHDILVKTNETEFIVNPTRDKPTQVANQVSRSS